MNILISNFPFSLMNFYYFSFKGSISLTCPNSHHHYTCSSGPFLEKMKVIWTQALRYHANQSDNNVTVFHVTITKYLMLCGV